MVHTDIKDAAFLVRPATDRDMAQIAGIYAHAVLHGLATFEEEPPTIEELKRRRDSVIAKGLPYLIAESGGQVLGYTYANDYRPRPAYRHTIENSVYVAQDAYRRGVGRRLLMALICHCEAGPWRQMVAVIGDRDNAGSIDLHRAMGFRDAGTLHAVGFKFGRWVDSVIMQRPIGVGAQSLPETGTSGAPQ